MSREDFQNTLKNNPFSYVNDLVYDHILQDIIDIKLIPGEKISIIQIANLLGVSRSPVRIAIERLLSEKLILRNDNKELYISPLEKKNYFSIYEARKAIEGSASYYASKKINDSEVNELKTIVKKMRDIESTSIDDYIDEITPLDLQFHYNILKASHNPYFLEMYENIKIKIQRYRYYQMYRYKNKIVPKDFIIMNTREHYAILRAVMSGMSLIAKNEMESHIESMRNDF